MKTDHKSIFAAVFCVLFVVVAVEQSSTAQSTSRGMQTAPPRQTYDSQSPRGNVIDFTNTRNNNPQINNPALGNSRQIPLQNMPFGERPSPQANVGQIFNNGNQAGQEFANTGRNVLQKANEAGKQFWQNATKPFKLGKGNTPQYNLPANLNRKPNYTDQTLTDSNPLASRFKLPTLEKPAWMKKLDQKVKSGLGIKTDLQQAGSGLADRLNGARQNGSQAWQNYTQGNAAGSQTNPSPPTRSANNDWLNNIQQPLVR